MRTTLKKAIYKQLELKTNKKFTKKLKTKIKNQKNINQN
jgi:hypothetical protein